MSIDFIEKGFQKNENLNASKFSSSEFVDHARNKKRNLDTSKINSSVSSNDDLNLFLFGGKKNDRSLIRDEIEQN